MTTAWRLRTGLVGALLLALLVTPAMAQKRGGTLTIVRPTDPVSLDPQLETTAPGAWVYYNILEPLITLDEKMQIQLKLATSYEVMSPTKVRFKLRPNVKFHDGTPLNAAAVKFSFDRALKGTPPARSSPRSPSGPGGRAGRSFAPWPWSTARSSRRPPCRRWGPTSAARRSGPAPSSSSSGRRTRT